MSRISFRQFLLLLPEKEVYYVHFSMSVYDRSNYLHHNYIDHEKHLATKMFSVKLLVNVSHVLPKSLHLNLAI